MELIGKKDSSGCRLWLDRVDKDGYGQVSINGIDINAHRLVWMIKNKTNLPSDVLIRHSCDNPPCVNYKHLCPGTIQDNANDMIRRGRSLKGEKDPYAIFSDDDVRKMHKLRKQGMSYKEIGQVFNKPKGQIWEIINKHWKHLR